MNTIEILDKDTNKKQVYVLKDELDQEEEEHQSSFWFDTFPVVVESIIKLAAKVLKFSLYLLISFLKLFIKIIEALFLQNYNPLGFVSKATEKALDDRAKKNINQERIRFAVNQKTMHKFEFDRSTDFSNNYKVIQERLKQCTDMQIRLNNELYKDTLKRIDILVVEAERKALQEGYSYAKETNFKLDDEAAYQEYIRNKIMKGEGTSINKVKEGDN
ncbi:MAG: hypothetical protein ACI3VR_00615 [Intestinibacter sp.]|uniref:hypothetical protein n=1 Tax=Intestinibacter sp. TaxID=1965304 RepID=UPI003F144A6A